MQQLASKAYLSIANAFPSISTEQAVNGGVKGQGSGGGGGGEGHGQQTQGGGQRRQSGGDEETVTF